ncbi:hypothetical protein [Massilia phosphatilytica]
MRAGGAQQGTQQDARQGQGAAHHLNCRLTMVAFWISTFAPLFWITTGMPDMLANAPVSMLFDPVTTFTALLPETTPLRFALLVAMNVSVPPRECSSLPRSAAGPNPSASAAFAVLSGLAAGCAAGVPSWDGDREFRSGPGRGCAGREHSDAAHAVAGLALE